MIIPNKKLKIALVGFRLSNGGAEKVMANLSIFLEKNNIEVHNIIIEDGVAYPFAGTLVNIGLIKNKRNDVFNKLKRLIALRQHLNRNKFDYIIDFRYRTKIIQEFIILKLIYNTKTIFTIHSYRIKDYLPKNLLLTRFYYQNAVAIISITKKMQDLVLSKYQLTNVKTIFNSVNLEEINSKMVAPIEIQFEYSIAVGQYVNNIKQFDKLIESYAKSNLPSQNIHLVILGDGTLKKYLQEVINNNNILEKVHLIGHKSNPYCYISKAKFLVLCSKYEGMPNVILEALACKTPVISFDCDSGPNEIIVNKQNGLLVENQNWNELIKAMNLLVENNELYNFCKNNTLDNVQPFSLDTIGKEWLNLLHTQDKI